MKSGGPWNLRGLRPQAREAARAAARRSGMSVGEWLNSVIRPTDEEDGEFALAAGFDHDSDDSRRQSFRYDDRELHGGHRDANWRGRDRESDDQWRQNFRYEEREQDRRHREAHWRGRDRESDDQMRLNLSNDDRERGRHRDANWRRDRESGDQWRQSSGRDDREQHGQHRNANLRHRDRMEEGEVPVRREGGPYREEHRGERVNRSRWERDRYHERADPRPSQDDRDASIDQAVAEITARQRVLDGKAAAEPAFTPPQAPPLSPVPEHNRSAWNESPGFESAPATPIDLSGVERQLRQITTRIEALRPASDLETAIHGLRTELTEIGRLLTEALPRRAVESLEIEIKALAQRIDHSRQSGVDATALAGLERGLSEVREGLRGLTTAESLVGVDEAVKALAKKVDVIAAKDDPAALQQLETAIGALRGIVSHVASNDTLTKVAEDVRSLAAKVDGLATSAASGHALSALENRIDLLATALNASTEAGHAVPRELEKLLGGLIEKLEWVQLTHTDHTALAHLEDRIATLVKRLDASDSRLGLLEGVERGLADLLVYIEQLRGAKAGGEGGAKVKPVAVDAIEHEVAEIKQTERRTQDSLEAVQGTVEHVVDRLAMIESDMRGDKARTAPAEPLPMKAQQPTLAPLLKPAAMPTASAAAAAAPMPPQPEPAPHRPTPARRPIDPNLPPDHPLEPGFAAGRSRQPPSAADRIAASEAAVGSKPPVIPDPGGGKPDFIAAARRAAQAAAAASPNDQSRAEAAAGGPTQSKKLTERLRNLIVAAAVVVIVVGCFHIVSRLFEDGGSGAPAQVQTEPPHLQTEPPQVQTEKSSPPTIAAPEANPTTLPTTIPVPLPGADPAENPGAPPLPSSTPGTTTGVGPGKQSLLNDTAAPFAMAAGTLPAGDMARVNGIAAGLAPGPATDITGTLPGLPAMHYPATAPAPTVDDKLPVAIAGPALRAAALAGDASAAYEVAVRFSEGRVVPPNNEEAARWFERAAKKGLAPAQFRLGTLYEKGLGVKKDFIAARDLYRAAADKGHGKAMHNLAVLYAEGIDGAADYRTAAQWFRKAADHGITDSQYNLAVLYARGIGVEQNFAESYKWFFLAAKEGDNDAAKKRDEVASHLDQQSLAAARLAAQTWTPQPQPADAITVKAPGASEPPANGSSAAKPKARSAKAPAADAAKFN